jgi:hypothetical protein
MASLLHAQMIADCFDPLDLLGNLHGSRGLYGAGNNAA